MAIKVVQWTSGGVARQAVRAIVSDTRMELVGMFAFSKEKVGQDAGELCGLDPLGLGATDEIEKLIQLAPDVVSYCPLYPDIDHLVQILEAGINVVTTCNFLTGWGLDYNADRYGPNPRQRLQEAALRGGASLFGTGINPGHVNYQACVMSALCEKVNHLLVSEVVHEITPFLGDPNIAEFGYGQPLDTPGLAERQKKESAVFGDAIEMMASVLGLELEEIRCSADLAPANQDFDTPGGLIAKGTIAGVRLRWEGIVGGRPMLENRQIWVTGDKADGIEGWGIPKSHGYVVDIQGDPIIHNTMIPIPRGDLSRMTMEQSQIHGMKITAFPAVNAIPAVCAAEPGIRTYKDLPTTGAGGLSS